MSVVQRLKTSLLGSVPYFPATVKQRKCPFNLPATLAGHRIPRFSIIIPTQNRPAELGRCLRSILAQSVRPDEIVVVDNGTIDTRNVLTALDGQGISTKYIYASPSGIARARNVGMREATGEIKFFLDDDIVLSPTYCEEILKVFIADREKMVGGVNSLRVGKNPPPVLSKPLKRKIGNFLEFVFSLQTSNFEGMQRPNGCHRAITRSDAPIFTQTFGGVAAYRREVLDEFSFDETNFPGYTVGEDFELGYRISKRYLLVTTPFAQFEHFPGKNGRPGPFRAKVQEMYRYYRPMALNDELGLSNYLLMGWLFTGEQIKGIAHLAFHFSDEGTRSVWMLVGQSVGAATFPMSISSRNALFSAWNRWLSKAQGVV